MRCSVNSSSGFPGASQSISACSWKADTAPTSMEAGTAWLLWGAAYNCASDSRKCGLALPHPRLKEEDHKLTQGEMPRPPSTGTQAQPDTYTVLRLQHRVTAALDDLADMSFHET